MTTQPTQTRTKPHIRLHYRRTLFSGTNWNASVTTPSGVEYTCRWQRCPSYVLHVIRTVEACWNLC